ncbi:MAG TPA: tetratricopeptide repeat protein [Terriglobales bacterium]|nr:tetratricopeptide repeat protein [Terriglobales bacterium]
MDTQKRLLTRENLPVSLTPKVIETLIFLVENRDRVVSKDELMKALWPDSFVEESNLSQNIFVLRKALGDSQEKRYILTVPGRGYQFIETVREPGEQSQKGLQEEDAASQSAALTIPTVTHTNWRWVSIAALILLVIGVVAYRWRYKADSTPKGMTAPAAVKLRRSIAVLEFRNLSQHSEDAWLSTALAEMFRTELAAGDQLRVVPGDQIAQASHEVSLVAAATLSRTSLIALRSNLETDYVALGDFTVLGEGSQAQIRLDLRLQDTAQGEVIAQATATGNQSDLFTLIFQVGSQIRQHFSVGNTSTEQEEQVRASVPANPKSARLYAEGLSKLREFEYKIAFDLLNQAAIAEPKSAEVHAALGSAWQALGYDAKAIDETQKAMALGKTLRSEDQLSLEGQYRRLNHEWSKAIEIYRTLNDLYPDNLDYALRLAQSQQTAGIGKDGLATLATARKLPSPIGDDPRIDVLEAGIRTDIGDFKTAQLIAAQGIEKGKQRHARLVLAQALRAESSVLSRLGENDQATKDMNEAKVLFAAAGDLRSSGMVISLAARMAYTQGKYEEARKFYEEALTIYRQVGNRQSAARTIEAIGNVYYAEGQLPQAKRQYEEALVIARELESKVDISSMLGNIANVLDALGEVAASEKAQEQALQLFKETGNKRGEATTENNLANVFIEEGELAKAEQHYLAAIALGKETGEKSEHGYDLLGWSDVLYYRDDLKNAQEKAEQSLAIRKEIGDQVETAYTWGKLALIYMEQGHLPEAEKFASDAVHQLENADVPENLATANSILTFVLLREGKSTDAQIASQRAIVGAAKTTERATKFSVALAAARVDIAMRKFTDAKNKIAPVLAQAGKVGNIPFIFDARLAMGEIALKSGQLNAAHKQLTALEKDARSKGFLLIARQAGTLNTASRQN